MSGKRRISIFGRVLREVRRIAYKNWLLLRRVFMPPAYKARLIFAARASGILNWDTPSHSWTLPGGYEAILKPRDAGSLAAATEFHIDVAGFPDRAAAAALG